jgi:hypothetical protein
MNYQIGLHSNATVNILPARAGLPVVTVIATDPHATEPGTNSNVPDTGTFTIFRSDGTNLPLTVSYALGGTASNGVDYTLLSGSATIPAGDHSAQVIVNPLADNLAEGTETVVLHLLQPLCATNSTPVTGCYVVGIPGEALVTIDDGRVPPPTNCRPIVRIASPANGTVFHTPVDIPIFAYARACTGSIVSVEFFAGTNSLGFGNTVTNIPPTPTNVLSLFSLVWSNAALGAWDLRARALDTSGALTTSEPVHILVEPTPPPPTNRPAIVTICATDPIAIEGTNCWVRYGVTNLGAGWPVWGAGNRDPITNCGPKNAVFTVRRMGDITNALDVTYEVGGTASNGVDYVALPGAVTIPAGSRFALITVVPLEDTVAERPETVVIGLKTPTNQPPTYVLGIPRRAAAIILDSDNPVHRTSLLTDRLFHLNANGPDGAWFRIESSGDAVNWAPICTNQVVNGSIDFIDPDGSDNPQKFYRAVAQDIGPQE